MGEEANVHRVAIGLQSSYLNCSTVIHFVCASPVAHVARRLTAHTVHYHIIIILYQHQWNGIEYYPSRERVRPWQGEN